MSTYKDEASVKLYAPLTSEEARELSGKLTENSRRHIHGKVKTDVAYDMKTSGLSLKLDSPAPIPPTYVEKMLHQTLDGLGIQFQH